MDKRVGARTAILFAILAASGPDARGQIEDVQPGDRVRISIANLQSVNQWTVGRLAALDTTSVTIVENRNSRALSVLLRDLDGFQKYLGRDAGRGARWIGGGAAFGFVLGAGLTLGSEQDESDDGIPSWVTAGIGFAALGGIVGGILGFQEQWGDVLIRVEPTASAGAEPTLRATASF